MAKHKLTPVQELQEYVNRLAERYAHWEKERHDGCVDPNWSDGVNLNLVRNHIINFKRQIRRTCDNFDFFVTNGKNYNPQRIARILGLRGYCKPKPVQLTLF